MSLQLTLAKLYRQNGPRAPFSEQTLKERVRSGTIIYLTLKKGIQ